MDITTQNNDANYLTLSRCAGILLFLLICSFTAASQNTKGDRPQSSREGRFKVSQKKQRPGKSTSPKRIGTRRGPGGEGYSPRGKARGGERAGRPIKPVFNVNKPKETQRAWRGDLSGRPLRHKNSSSVKTQIHRQSGEHVRRRVPNREGRQNVTGGRPVRIPSATGKFRKVYPQKGRYVNNSSPVPRDNQKAVSNRQTLARLRTLQSDVRSTPPGKKVKVVPRSASRAFIRHKSINVYANFARPKKKGERAQTTDLAGRKIRGRNFQTPRQAFIKAPNIYRGRRIDGKDRPYSGPSGGYRSATRGSSAWRGDIAGRAIRHRDRTSKRSVEGRPSFAGRVRSRISGGKPGTRLPPRAPGIGAIGIDTRGNRKISRRFSDQGVGFTGFIKRKGKQPTNVSGIPVKRRLRGAFGDQGEEFSGFGKGRGPVKGGGSVSGRLWNNNGVPVAPRTPKNAAMISGIPVKRRLPRSFNDQGEEFTGFVKARRPVKGGGSVSGKLWNNKEAPIAGRQPLQGERAANYSGNLKAKRPLKGGGSVSGKLWNNNETPIQSKLPPPQAGIALGFKGKHKLPPGFSDQGEEFTGFIKLSRFRKNYVQNKLAHEESLKKQRPEKGINSVMGLQIKVKRRDYVTNKNSSEEALKKLKPTKSDRDVGELYGKVKQYHYVRNPSSASEALKVREPGKAFARVTDYQGNIKMRKFDLGRKNPELHPDARFVRTNKNNVKEERDALTNFRLWWARLFRKQETQPDHLKEKGKKPRYDKGEQGLWYD